MVFPMRSRPCDEERVGVDLGGEGTPARPAEGGIAGPDFGFLGMALPVDGQMVTAAA